MKCDGLVNFAQIFLTHSNQLCNFKSFCHVCHMHGLIHDSRLQACQSCLLKLMYVLRLLYAIRCLRVMSCLGFQLVGSHIKGQAFPFSCQFFQNSFVRESFLYSQIGFLDAHDGYYMATVYIHYVFFRSFQFNSRKTTFYCLMLKAADFSCL